MRMIVVKIYRKMIKNTKRSLRIMSKIKRRIEVIMIIEVITMIEVTITTIGVKIEVKMIIGAMGIGVKIKGIMIGIIMRRRTSIARTMTCSRKVRRRRRNMIGIRATIREVTILKLIEEVIEGSRREVIIT
jgi:hypothetical protein